MPFARYLAVLWLPAVIVAGAASVALDPAALPAGMRELLPAAPYGVAAVGALLAARFHQSRAVFALAVLAFAHGALAYAETAGGGGDLLARGALVLVPLNIAVIACLSERGVLTGRGLFRIAAIGAQAVALAWIALAGDAGARADVAALLDAPIPGLSILPGGLDHLALAAFAAAAVALGVRFARGGLPLEAGFLAALAAVAGAGAGLDGAAMLTGGALALAAAVVQDGYRLAYRDELTGLPGRRALMTEMAKLGGRYAVAMLDVDHFKKFNDTYGHDVGDQVLRMVASRVGAVSGGGKGFRYGGEEFTVLFPGRTAEAAHEHLEALREAVAASAFRLRAKDRPKSRPKAGKAAKKPARGAKGKTVSVTISIGVADSETAETPEAALKAADQKLYKAKKAGRNRVAV